MTGASQAMSRSWLTSSSRLAVAVRRAGLDALDDLLQRGSRPVGALDRLEDGGGGATQSLTLGPSCLAKIVEQERVGGIGGGDGDEPPSIAIGHAT